MQIVIFLWHECCQGTPVFNISTLNILLQTESIATITFCSLTFGFRMFIFVGKGERASGPHEREFLRE